jgi:hypothetical protein
MSALVLSTVMDAIGTTLVAGAITKRVFPYPVEEAEVPFAIVGYPDAILFDLTFHTDATHGSDEATFPIWLVVGGVTGKASRDALSALLAFGAGTIRSALNGNLGGAVQDARVVRARPEVITFGGAPVLAARVDLEVMS